MEEKEKFYIEINESQKYISLQKGKYANDMKNFIGNEMKNMLHKKNKENKFKNLFKKIINICK